MFERYKISMKGNVEIVSTLDSDYKEWCSRRAQRMRINENWPKDLVAQKHNVVCREIERETLVFLEKNYSISMDIALKFINERTGRATYKELDFVLMKGNIPNIIGEIKHSSNPEKAISRANLQNNRALNIARRKWPELSGIRICYFLESQFIGSEAPQVDSGEKLGMAMNSIKPGTSESFILSAEKLFAELELNGQRGRELHVELVKTRAILDDAILAMKPEVKKFSNTLGPALDEVLDPLKNE